MSSLSPVLPIRVVQISDTHLFAQSDGELLGMDTQFSFTKVLELVQQEQGSRVPPVACVLATGDLAQDGSVSAYAHFESLLRPLQHPIIYLPGNHDSVVTMERGLSAGSLIAPCFVDHGNWRIIMLDSTIPNKVYGGLNPECLRYLEATLDVSRAKHVMICLHHHPIQYGSEWLDSGGLQNPGDLFAVTDKYSNVRGMIWGHVHQVHESERNKVRFFSPPSTCIQFKPNSDDFALDALNPGYRYFDLFSDGRIDSVVSRVEGVEFDVDMTTQGY